MAKPIWTYGDSVVFVAEKIHSIDNCAVNTQNEYYLKQKYER